MKCLDCQAYVAEKLHCHRYPVTVEKYAHDFCMEFKPKEVVVCPVVEKEKVNEEKVVEKVVVSEPEIFTSPAYAEPKKRGWPAGRPRK